MRPNLNDPVNTAGEMLVWHRSIGDETPQYPGLPITPVVERILKKITFQEQNRVVGIGPCWMWTGRLNRNGYGRAWYNPLRKEIPCHRILYFEMIGPIPTKHVLDHICRRRACCSPWHVEPVTHRENTLRGEAVLFKPIS